METTLKEIARAHHAVADRVVELHKAMKIVEEAYHSLAATERTLRKLLEGKYAI